MKSSTDYKPTQAFGLLLIGPPGSGKTSAALMFPSPYIADCDNNLGWAQRNMTRKGKAFKYDTINIDDAGETVPDHMRWKRLVSCVLAATKDPEIKTIIVDSLTMVADYLIADILARPEHQKNKHGLHEMEIRDWGTVKNDMAKLIMALRAKGKTIIFTAHEKYDKDEMTGILKFEVNFPGQLKDIIPAYFSDMWRCEVKETIGKPPTYITRSQPTARISLKNSLDLPNEFELTSEQLEKWLGGVK